jgi:hypothetical protein
LAWVEKILYERECADRGIEQHYFVFAIVPLFVTFKTTQTTQTTIDFIGFFQEAYPDHLLFYPDHPDQK